MKVFRGLASLPSRPRPSAITIGNFDGVHRGHRAVIRQLEAKATEGAVSTLVTFDPHPQKVLRGVSPPALATPSKKLELLEETGIAQVVILPFTRALSRVEPEAFIEEILVGGLNMRSLVVGADFRFGRMARGDVTMLRGFSRRFGFSVQGARIAELAGRRVSSTAIRHALGEGDLDWANRALGRPHQVDGVVVKGAGRGGDLLGFPTANLRPRPGLCLPGPGIYAGLARTSGGSFKAAISVGTNPTFGKNPITVEAYLLDFDADLYGKPLELRFLKYLRGEKRYRSVTALREAMEADVAMVRRTVRHR